MIYLKNVVLLVVLLTAQFSFAQSSPLLNPNEGETDAEVLSNNETAFFKFWATRNQPYEITLRTIVGNADLYGSTSSNVSSSNYQKRSTKTDKADDSFKITVSSGGFYYLAVKSKKPTTVYKIKVDKAPQQLDVTLDETSIDQGKLLHIDWDFSSQDHYFLYLHDSSKNPINTSSFLSNTCQNIEDVDGSKGCIFQKTTSETDSYWPIPADVDPGYYKIKVVVWDDPTGNANGVGFSPTFRVKSVDPEISNVEINRTTVEAGDTLKITWDSEDQEEVYFFLRKGGGVASTTGFSHATCQTGGYYTYHGCLRGIESRSREHFNWTIPEELELGDYKIRVKVHNKVLGSIETDSALTPSFSVVRPQPDIRNVSIENANTNSTGNNLNIKAGQRLKIEWDSDNQHHAFFYLYNANTNSPVNTSNIMNYPCSNSIDGNEGCLKSQNNSLEYVYWEIPEALDKGRYYIRVVIWSSDAEGSPSDSRNTPKFNIQGNEPLVHSVSINKTELEANETLNIQWDSENQHHAIVYLFDKNQSQAINTSAFLSDLCQDAANGNPNVSMSEIAAQGCIASIDSGNIFNFNWTAPANLPADRYSIKVAVWNEDLNDHAAAGYSPRFDIITNDGTAPPINCQTDAYSSVADWAQPAACYLADHGIVTVPNDYNLRGSDYITRAETATLILRTLLHLANVDFQNNNDVDEIIANYLGYVPTSPFADINDASTWYYLAVVTLSHLEYDDDISVFDRGSAGDQIRFLPNDPIQRGWVLKALLEAWNIKPLTASKLDNVEEFSDIDRHHPAAPYIYAAREAGIASGASSTEFSNNNARRQDVFKWLYELIQQRGAPQGLEPQSFGYTGRCNYLGSRYEQPILYGVQTPNVDIKVVQPLQDGSMVLEATNISYDSNTFTDTDGATLSASPFLAWRTNGGCLFETNSNTNIRFTEVRWVAPDGFTPNNNTEFANYDITVYLGDALGSEVSASYVPESLAPVNTNVKPAISIEDIPTLIAGRRVTIIGTANDANNTSNTSLHGVREIRMWYEIAGKKQLIAANIPVQKDNQWKLNWWIPNTTGSVKLYAAARNLAGNLSVVSEQATIRPAYVIAGYVTDSNGLPLTNAKVRLDNGNQETIADNQGWFLFDDGVSSGTHSVQATYDNQQSDKLSVQLNSDNARASVALVVDREPPILTVWASPQAVIVGNSVTIQVAANEKLDSRPDISLQLPSGTTRSVSLVENIDTGVWEGIFDIANNTSPGSVTLEATATDRYGNSGSAMGIMVIEPLSLDNLAIELPSNVLVSGGKTRLDMAYADALDVELAYAWEADCAGLPTAGTFTNASSSSPNWTAPVNTTGSVQDCVLRVTMTTEDNSEQQNRETYVAIEPLNNTANKAIYTFTGDVYDSSGYGHHAYADSISYGINRLGQDDNAIEFNGNGSVLINDAPYLGKQRKFTIMAWVKNQNGGMLVQQGNGICNSASDQAFSFGITPNNNRLSMSIHGENGTSTTVSSTTSISQDNQWHLLTGVFEAGQLRLYIDGEPNATSNAGFEIMADVDAPIVIGNSINTCTDTLAYSTPFSGSIDDLALHGYAMSYAQIRAAWIEWLVQSQGIPEEALTTLSADFRMHIPVMWLTNTTGEPPVAMWSELKVIPQNDQLLFEVLDYGVHTATPQKFISDPSMSIAPDGKWHVFIVGMRYQPIFGPNQFIWADLKLVSEQPLELDMQMYDLN